MITNEMVKNVNMMDSLENNWVSRKAGSKN